MAPTAKRVVNQSISADRYAAETDLLTATVLLADAARAEAWATALLVTGQTSAR